MTFGAHIPELQLTAEQVRLGLGAAGLQAGETYVELGSGEGRNLVVAARDFGAKARGIEILPHAIEESHRLAQEAGVEVEIVQGDLMTHPLGDADVVLIHLGPAFHDILADRLADELSASARVVACGWRVPGFQHVDTAHEFDDFDGHIYRPGDPRTNVTWIEPIERIAGQPGTRWLAELVVLAHADLDEVRIECEPGDSLVEGAEPGRRMLLRGQTTTVMIWGTLPPAGAEEVVTFSVHARYPRDPQRPEARRGTAHNLRLVGTTGTD